MPAGLSADDYDKLYGPNSAPLRQSLGFGGQNNIDMLSPSRGEENNAGGEGGAGGYYIKPDENFQKMLDAGQIEYGNKQNHDPTANDEMGYWVNWDKMPKTVFGQPKGGEGTASLSGYDDSLDPLLHQKDAKSYDPNFGWVTPTANIELHEKGLAEGFYQALPAIVATFFTAGAGLPALAAAGATAAQSAGNGDYTGAALNLASAGIGAAGYGPVAQAAPGMAYNAAKGNWGGVASSAAGLAAGQAGAPSWAAPIASAGAGYLANSLRNPTQSKQPQQSASQPRYNSGSST
jgi:hypothetical protein